MMGKCYSVIDFPSKKTSKKRKVGIHNKVIRIRNWCPLAEMFIIFTATTPTNGRDRITYRENLINFFFDMTSASRVATQ
jgi:hypothetical protein